MSRPCTPAHRGWSPLARGSRIGATAKAFLTARRSRSFARRRRDRDVAGGVARCPSARPSRRPARTRDCPSNRSPRPTRIRRTLVRAIEDDDFRPAAATSTPAGTSAPSPRRSASTRAAARRSSTPATERDRAAAGHRGLRVRDRVPAAERRGPNWSAAMGAALVLVVVYGVAQAVTATATATPTAGPRRRPRRRRPQLERAAPSAAASPSTSNGDRARSRRRRATASPWCVHAREVSWVQATTASGKELFQGTSTRADQDLHRPQRIKLVVGNAGAVTLTVNGTDVGAPGGRAGGPRPVHAPGPRLRLIAPTGPRSGRRAPDGQGGHAIRR